MRESLRIPAAGWFWLCLTLLVAAQAWPQEQQAPIDPYSIRITAVIRIKLGDKNRQTDLGKIVFE